MHERPQTCCASVISSNMVNHVLFFYMHIGIVEVWYSHARSLWNSLMVNSIPLTMLNLFYSPIFLLIDWGSYAHVWLSMKHRMMLCNNLLGVVSWRIWWRSWWVQMCISECVQRFKKSKCFMSILTSPLNILSQNFCSTSLLIIFNIIAGEINNLKVKSLKSL